MGAENLVFGGDIVLAVEKIPYNIKNYENIRQILSQLDPGDAFRVKIFAGRRATRVESPKNSVTGFKDCEALGCNSGTQHQAAERDRPTLGVVDSRLPTF